MEEKIKLYEIGRELMALEQALLENEGELPDEELDRYLALQENEATKIENICNWLVTLEANAAHARARIVALEALIKQEKERWESEAHRNETTAARVTQRLKVHFLTVRNGEQFKTSDGRTVKLAKVGGKRALLYPAEWDQEPARAPEQFHRRKIELDKVALRETVESRENALKAANTTLEVQQINEMFKQIAAVKLAEQGVKLVIK